MKVTLKILLFLVFLSTFIMTKDVDIKPKKMLKTDSSLLGTVKFTHQYGKFTPSDDSIERKRSHKRRRAVRKPRKGRGY